MSDLSPDQYFDLLLRLRSKYCCDTANCKCDESADAIEALRKERDALRDLLHLWDDLIEHQYSGSRAAMSDMTYIAQATKAALTQEPKP